MVLQLMLSCQNGDQTEIIFTKSTEEYEITLSKIHTKVDANGKAQCSKYAKTIKNDTLFSSYGLELKSLIAASKGTSAKYISELPIDSLNAQYLDVQIKKQTNTSLDYDYILMNALSSTFNIHIQAIDSNIQGYSLITSDTNLLKQYQVKCSKGVLEYKNEIWSARSFALEGILKTMDQHSNKFISNEAPDEDCYTFDFITGNDIQLINQKLEPIGFFLKPREITQVFYTVKRG